VSSWTIFTNHAQVLILLLEDPTLRIRDLAERLSITERGTQRIIAELIEEGYLTREREGRRSSYQVDLEKTLRCPVLPSMPTLTVDTGAGAEIVFGLGTTRCP